jgi:hypothetical protein
MSYAIRITRGLGSEISRSEWLQVVDRAPDLRRGADYTEATNPGTGEVIRINNLDLTEWLGHPSGQIVPLNYSRGEVTALNPDDATIERLKSLARTLGAHVEGEGGEHYE